MVTVRCPIFAVLVLCTVRTECGGLPTMQCNPLFRSLGHVGHSHYFYSSKAVGWHEANRTCRSYQNTHLANIPDEDTLYLITERAAPVIGRVGDKTSFWFGAHEVTFRQWRWFDDQIYNGRMIDYGANTKKTCGLVDGTKVDHLAYGTCTAKKRFLCVNPDAGSSDLVTDDYYISTPAEAATWFQARESCLCRGMDLAIAKVGSVDYIYMLLNGSTNHFWIGLQKARFVWENTEDTSVEPPKVASQFQPEDTSVARPKVESQLQPEPAENEPETKPQTEKTGDAGIMVGLSVLVVVAIIALTLVLVVLRAGSGNNDNTWQRFSNNGEDEGM